jgi:hypothetical protein
VKKSRRAGGCVMLKHACDDDDVADDQGLPRLGGAKASQSLQEPHPHRKDVSRGHLC